jgi:hypothetical protein
MSSEAALLDRALHVAREHAPHDAELLELLERLCKAATTLLFAPAGRDAAGRSLWLVGDPERPLSFAARTEGMRRLHMLARFSAVAVGLVSERGPEAARKLLKRCLAELREYCPALADELGTFSIEDNGEVVRYHRRPDSPRVLPRGGNPAVCVATLEPGFSEEIAA